MSHDRHTGLKYRISGERQLCAHLQRHDAGCDSRWAVHETPGIKPKPEFLGPGLQTISLPITLSASLGVRPRSVLESIEQMVETGEAEYFILGNRPVGANRFRITGASETWDLIYNKGELARASLTITLEEYT